MVRVFARWARSSALILLSVVLAGKSIAQDERAQLLERRIKAALIYRFVNHVEWPESSLPPPGAPFAICITGADALASELADFATGRTVLNRPLSVHRPRSAAGARECQIVFVGKAEAAQLPSVIRSAPPGALIVTEVEDGLRPESVINFVVVDGQVRFQVSLDAARKRHLRLSARLLSVAHNIQGAH